MGTPVRAAVGKLRLLGPSAGGFADFLSCNNMGFLAANEDVSESFPFVVRRGGAKGYGLFCGPRPARAGEEVLRVPPALWLPYCAEVAVRKAEAGAPDVLARLSNSCAKIGGGAASKLAPVACLALELLFTLERDAKEPYLGLLWETSRSEGALPHPLLMGPEHLDWLQASPLRGSIDAAARIYGTLHRSLLGLEGGDADSLTLWGEGQGGISTPSASSTRDFLWALGVILSRGISEDGAGGTGLVPYLDFANHGEGGRAVGNGGASCERGFDEATGNHYLRTLRDVAPGEELLIDYGSATKGMYRFARTYGFIDLSCSKGGSGSGNSSSRSSSRGANANCSASAEDSSKGGSHNDMKEELRHRKDSSSSCTSDSLRVHVELPQQHELVVPVRLADVAYGERVHDQNQIILTMKDGQEDTAGFSRKTRQEDTAGFSKSTAPAPPANVVPAAQPGNELAAAETKALEERLSRYPTAFEEDLELLGRLAPLPSSRLVVSEGTGKSAGRGGGTHRRQTGKSAATPGEALAGAASAAVTAEWVEMCVALRVAEKLALRRALCGIRVMPQK